MNQRRVNLALGTVGTLFLTIGCTQHYHGPAGVVDGDTGRDAAHQRAVQERDAKSGATPADTDSEAGRTQAEFVNAGPVAQSVADAQGPRRIVGALGLYGHLDGAGGGGASPLDSSGDSTRVTFTTEGADFDPDVDRRGERLVYASTRHRDTADLYIKNVSGTAITQLTNDPANEQMPAFSPDGRKIAFASDRAGNWDIYVMDARGGQAVQITNDTTHDIHPSWSPDGRQLVYCSLGGPSGQWEMVIVDVDNPSTRRVIGNGLFPNWSPVEDKIVFQRARQRGTRWFSVWTVSLVDGEVTPPTEVAVSSNAAVITPAWSPDGRMIVFCTVVDPAADEHTRPEQADVWVVSEDGRSRTKLTEGSFSNLQPVWSSDNAILFVSNRGAEGVENIWAMQAGRVAELTAPQRRPEASASVPTE